MRAAKQASLKRKESEASDERERGTKEDCGYEQGCRVASDSLLIT